MVRAVPTRSTIGRYGHPKGPRIFTVRAAHGKTCGPRTAPTPCPVPTPNRFAHTGLVPFFPYRPHTVLPPCCHYKSLPTRTAPVPPPYRFARTGPVPFCPYRPRTVLSPCCPYKPLLLFLSSLLLFCLDEFPSQQFIPKVKIRDGVNGSFMRILRKS